jgi:hyaluronate lyase
MSLRSVAQAATAIDATADFARIVAAYRALQIGTNQPSAERTQAVAALDQVARCYDATMDVTGTQLWPDLPSGSGSNFFPTMYYRLRTIAVDWATHGSALSSKAGMAQRIITALDILHTGEYNENTGETGNWYSYEIAVPHWLLQILVALGDELTPDQLAPYLAPVLAFVPDPNLRTNTGSVETGANRADKALITVVSGALAQDANRVAAGVGAVTDQVGDGAASLVARVSAGDGYRADGSFVQHDVVPYAGHYGLVLLTAVAGLIEVTSGTSTQLPAEVKQWCYDTVADVYAPFVTSGAVMEPVRGRMLSRQGETGFDAGHQLTAAIVLLARSAPEPAKSTLAGFAARFVGDDNWAPYLNVTDLARFSGGLQPVGVPEIEYARALLATRPRPAPKTRQHRVFPQQDRMVHVTDGWSASLGVGSARICRYESINGQNLHGWYVGDGVLYTFLPGDQGHYSDAYWPTVDATLLPGTTTKDSAPPALQASPPLTPNAWVGGVRLDAGHGAHGLDFVSQDGTLTARKSWFFAPGGVFCLGAGITDTSGATVRTTIDNRNIGTNGAQALLSDDRPVPTTLGQTTILARPRWLHLDGVAGYLLVQPASVTVLREDRTASWFSIDTGANTHGTLTPFTRRFQKIVLGHGANPAGASYAYVVLPGASASQTRSAVGDWQVLANTVAVQAVRLPGHITAASFFAAGSVRGIAVDGPAAVITDGETYAVADPTQVQTTVRLTVDRADAGAVSSDPRVTVVSRERQLVVDIDVTGSLGATHTFRVH